ncbi:hypothetical protein ZWY2020_026441 [Hordeum vulgare]|nr:hypothetical protein ZWY2020_026441 [Hordeum vulgare]
MYVLVKNPAGRTIRLGVHESDTLGSIKATIQERHFFVSNGVQLDDKHQDDDEEDEDDRVEVVKADKCDGDAGKLGVVADRFGATVHRRKVLPDMRLSKKAERPTTGVRPWISPIPKVNLQPLTLSNFFLPDWHTVKKKNRKVRPTVRPIVRQPVGTVPDLAVRHSLAKSRPVSAVLRAPEAASSAQTMRDHTANFLNVVLSGVGPAVAASLRAIHRLGIWPSLG